MGNRDLAHLGDVFTEEEVQSVANGIAAGKAPGPDGFIGIFFKQSRGVIKEHLMHAPSYFFEQHDQHLTHLNSAHLLLIPKKGNARRIGDYRPISLTHSFAKLVSKALSGSTRQAPTTSWSAASRTGCKILASRLAPELNELAQSA